MPMQEPQVEALFATPLFSYTVQDHEKLNEALIADAYAIRDKSPGVKRSNRNGWHSESDLFRRPEQSIQTLCQSIVEATGDVVANTTPPDVAAKFHFGLAAEGWININPPGGYNSPHVHSGFVWSGTYYAKVPSPKDSTSPAGAIEFIDPRTNANASNKLASFQAKRTIRPAPGALIIFPSYLLHWVLPNEGEDDRITFAFNVNIVGKARAANDPT